MFRDSSRKPRSSAIRRNYPGHFTFFLFCISIGLYGRAFSVLDNLECSFLNGSVCCLHSVTKTEAIKELIQKASVLHILDNTKQFTRDVLDREKRQTTGFGHGVAVAHARYAGLDSVIIALGISRKGIEYQAMDNKPVHLLFLIGSPLSLQDDYLRALSVLVKLVRRADFREALLNASSIPEIEEILHANFCPLLQNEQKKAV